MSYVRKIAQSATATSGMALGLKDLMVTAGWTLHDDRSAVSPPGYVMKSAGGESGSEMSLYVGLWWNVSGYADSLVLSIYLDWNATTHVETLRVPATLGASKITTVDSGAFTWWAAGDKSSFAIATKVSAIYYLVYTGIVDRFWTDVVSITQNAETSGSNVVVEVDDASAREANQSYQIVGLTEGRDRLLMTAVDTAATPDTVTVSSLPRNYAAGARIGIDPLPLVVSQANSPTAVYPLNFDDSVGTTVINTVMSADFPPYARNASDPDTRGGSKYAFFPLLVYEADNLRGWLRNVYTLGSNAVAIEDIFGLTKRDTGTSTGSNTTTTLNDTTKSWTVNAWANKAVLIQTGTGNGQIRKIVSNTATELTVDEAWTVTPDATSAYKVADEGWRCLLANYAVREV